MSETAARIARLSSEKRQLLETLLAELDKAQAKPEITSRRQTVGDGPVPLSFAQQRLWFIDQLESGNPFYNVSVAARLSGELKVTVLERTLSEVVRRHEALRTSFAMIDGEPAQVIAPALPITLPITDLSTSDEEEREPEMRRLAEEEARRPFDLSTGPVLRMKLLRLAEREHVLLCTTHHIVSDGWSMGLWLKEVATLYQAFAAGKPSPLPELTIQYADFAAWQRQWLTDEVLDQQLAYWKQQLLGAPAMLELPTDRPRPPVRSYRGARHSFQLSEELSARLKELARGEGATLFMVLLAAFDVLLSRYSGQEDIVVGTDVANRNRAETEQLIGFFVNQLVLRTDVSGNPSFRELLRRVREVALGAYAHQDIPFEKLVEELQPQRDLGRSPLFQVLFVVQNAPAEAAAMPALRVSLVDNTKETARFDLFLAMAEANNAISGIWTYRTDLFKEETILTLNDHFQTLLHGLCLEPDKPVACVPMLSEAERRRQIVEWNKTTQEYERQKSFPQLFEAQVAQRPEAVALVYEEQQLTYEELNARANQLAHHLRTMGVGPEVLVGISMERSIEMVVGVLGILKAGGAYVPLDPALPLERLAWILEDAGVPVLLTQESIANRLPTHWGQTLYLDTDWPQIAEQPEENPEKVTDAENLCYVIYTSGSTGQPKGVQVPQRALVNYCQAVCERLGEPLPASFATVSTFAADLGHTAVFPALCSGAALHVIAEDRVMDAQALANYFAAHEVECLKIVPSHLRALYAVAGGSVLPRRVLIVGGEATRGEWAREWVEARPECRLVNHYGPTECTVGVLMNEVSADESNQGTLLLGRPLRNTQAYVLDRELAVVPVGAVGELYIGGEGLARGYLNRPELTAEKFVADPFTNKEGARLYGTGDLVRYRRDGRLEFLGRVDEQVKVRGYRIELGEIEATLNQHPQVKESVVVATAQENGDKRLVAYVVRAAEEASTDWGQARQELRTYLEERLPAYMIPGVLVNLEAMPLTRNGKVDRQALPAAETQETPEKQDEAARTGVEELIAGIWSEVLQVKQVSRNDNFFELGGHSLLATQVVSRVRDVCGVEAGLRQLFEKPRLSEFAAAVEEMMRASDGEPAPPMEPADRRQRLPLSFAQQRLWFVHQLEPHSAVYNNPLAVCLSGELDVKALEGALSELVRRHEVLRTSFAVIDGKPVQVIAPAAVVELPIVDLSSQEEVRRMADEEARRPFDLSTGPMLRVQLLRVGQTEHVLLCTLHHIVSDGWSRGVLIKEVAALYRAFAAGESSPLPELTIQYADFAAWQRQWLTGAVLDQQLAYWKQQLQGAPALELPTDRPRPPVRSYLGAHLPLQISAELTEQLKQLARREGATLFMVLLAAFDVLLARYSGQDDIVVGTDIANRNRAETEQLIGFFVNQLVLRTDVSGNPSFREVLRQVREVTLGAYAHQDIPFEKLVEELQPERDLSRSPLFQVKLVLQNAPAVALQLPGLALRALPGSSETTQLDLTLMLSERDGELEGTWAYSTELFDTASIAAMARHFENLLAAVVAAPDRAVSSVALLGEEERWQLVVERNETRVEYASETVQQLFEQQVAQRPASVALVAGEEQLSYAELNGRANQLAHYLRQLGVGLEVVVGIYMERSLEQVVSVLGVLKAGGAYLPLDAKAPLERLAWMLEDAGVAVLLTQERLAERLPAHSGHTIYIDSEAEALAQQPEENPECVSEPEDLCYVIYTSGSTGRPKGVAIEQRGLLNYLNWSRAAYEYAEGGRTPLHSSLSFDMAVTSLYVPLLSGGTVELLSEEVEALGEALASGREYELVKVTPGHLQMLNWTVNGPQVKKLIVGGEQLLAETVWQWLEKSSQTRVFNEYGPTETVVGSSVYEVAAGDVRAGSVAIGRPVANTELYVLDEALEPVPVGVVGELYIGGAGVARGYLQRPELTAEKFVPDGFSAREGARLYRTGDRVRYGREGQLEFLGRVDEQVKVRGYRVELGEIEAALSWLSGVRECVVVAQAAEGDDQRLIAYLAPNGEALPNNGMLRTFLKGLLPEYMIPAQFVWLDEIPLTRNGKVDRSALPAPSMERPQFEAGLVSPRTPIEEILTEIWSEVLSVQGIGIHDNFFDLGGHSLLATRVVSRIREVLGIETSLRNLFASPTIAELRESIEAELRVVQGITAPSIKRADREQPLPLSFAQQRLWFIEQLERGNTAYNIPAALRLNGELNVNALERTLSEILRRHEVLRTSFLEVGGEPVQVIAPVTPAALPLLDLSALAAEGREAKVRQLAAEEARRPFDLSSGPMLRAQLLRLAETEHVLLCTMHHIVSDGWSFGLLANEIAALYRAFAAGEPSPLPELAIQYADFAAWQRQWLTGEVLDQQLSYWKQRLQDAPAVLELPTDRPRPPMRSYRGARLPLQISTELTEQLKQLARREGATLFMVLLAALDVLLSRYSGQKDIVVGTPIANRNRIETEQLIGFFVNQVVLRAEIEGSATFEQLVQQVKLRALEAYANQDLPFEQLIDALHLQRDMSYTPLFQVMFVLQNAPAGTLRLGELSLSPLEAVEETAKYDLLLWLSETERGLEGSFQYSTDLFDETTVSRMTEHWQVLLESVVAHPEESISALPMLSESERRQLLVEWNETSTTYVGTANIAQLFEAQVEQTPEALAVVYEAEQLSYAELNGRANQLARHLRTLGVGPEVVVGICMERSLELVVGLLGILKAGGAYLPLDPAYPSERLAFMLEDAGAELLLTQQRLLRSLPQRGRVVCLDRDWEEIAIQARDNPECVTEPEDLCYVIYTSGSTGKPKGVAIEQRGLLNYLNWSRAAYEYAEGGRTPLHSSLSFDMAVTSLYVPLVSGGTVELLSEEVEALGEALASGREYELVKVTPGHLQMLNWAVSGPQVKKLIVGGEQLLAETVWQWLEKNSETRVFNEYGPTEAVVGCCAYEVAAGDVRAGAVAIGRPVANTELYVLDEALEPVPVGVVGELYIGGAGVARGYLQRPELTAEKFVPDGFSVREGARLYRTGDLVRYRSEGQLEYLGRVDEQVKVRGFRVELGEIEAVLQQHERVKESVVIAGADRLVSYVVLAEGSEWLQTKRELREYLAQRLPEYMVPGVWVELTEMPLTRNGKVDRKALPEPEQQASVAAPREGVEELIAMIWSDLLRVKRVNSNDHFFELGGHSLLATQVVSRVRQLCEVDIEVRSVFQYPRLSEFSARVEEMRRAEAGVTAPPINRIDREQQLPLSFAQQRLWFVHQLEPLSLAYNLPLAVRLTGDLSIEALEQTLSEVVRRHEVLRTRFAAISGEPVQVIAEAATITLPLTDLSNFDLVQREAEARRFATEEARRPFDLSTGPLLRAQLLRLTATEHVLLCTMHHIVSDGWSIGLLAREVAILYRAFAAGEPSPLPELMIQYADFATWQRQWLTGEVLEKQLSYWKQQLQGAPAVLELPTDRPRPLTPGYHGAAQRFSLDKELSDGVKELSRREGATLFMVLLGAFNVLLSRYTGQDDIIVGTPIANRNRIETEDLIGFFVNMLVLRGDLSGNPRFTDLLNRLREMALNAYTHQDMPFGMLVGELKTERDMSNTELFQVALVLNNAPMPSLEVSGLKLSLITAEELAVRYDITLQVDDLSESFTVSWIYRKDLFEETTIAQMHKHFAAVLKRIVAHPEARLSTLKLLDARDYEEAPSEKEPDEISIRKLVSRTPTYVAIP